MGEEREQAKLVLIYVEFPSEKEVVCLSMDLISIWQIWKRNKKGYKICKNDEKFIKFHLISGRIMVSLH